MADHTTRMLLSPPLGRPKPYARRSGTKTRYKLPCLISLLLSILVACIVASVVVLFTSHQDLVSLWKIRPAVWLSILAGVYAVALGGLFSTGVAVIWWRCIAHGTTLERLHFIHTGASPKDFVPSFLAGSHARRVAVAAIIVFMTKLAIGPMLQRSTRPEPHEATRAMQMDIELAPEIPDGWFGTQDTFGANRIHLSQATFFGWNITTGNTTSHICPSNGTCEGPVKAAGLHLWNSTDHTTLNLLDPANVNETLFSINLTMNYDFDVPVLFLETRFVSAVDNNCIATVTREAYGMIPATMWYPITIQDDLIRPDIAGVIDNPSIVSNYSSSTANGTTGVLRAILGGFRPIYTSKAVLDAPREGKFARYALAREEGLNSFWADLFLNGVIRGPDQPENVLKHCPMTWESPTKHVLGRILGYMFRASRWVAAQRDDEQDKQTFTARFRRRELWHITDFGWLAASVAVMVLAMVSAFPLLWGWWQLDRYVTLSPLETGKALGAPILSNAGPEAEADAILRAVGRELVAYDGEVLVWAGSLYASGVGGSFRAGNDPKPRGSDEPGPENAPLASGNGRRYVPRHKRGVRSLNEADPIRVTRAFEHNRGYTTRKPYEDEEEIDIGQYGTPWAKEQNNDRVPLIQVLSNLAASRRASNDEGVPQQSFVPSLSAMRMRSLDERKRLRQASARSSLRSIEERDTPTPEGSGR